MSEEPLTEDEARTTAYKMTFKRFEPIENSISPQ